MAKKPTFTAQELDVLVDEVERKRLLLFSKFKNTITNADKKAAWEEVAQRVNAVGLGYNRTAEMVRNKWRDYSSVTKRKAAALRREQQRTGGGTHSVESLSPIEERVLGVLGEEALAGVRGGLDPLLERLQATQRQPSSSSSTSSQRASRPPEPLSSHLDRPTPAEVLLHSIEDPADTPSESPTRRVQTRRVPDPLPPPASSARLDPLSSPRGSHHPSSLSQSPQSTRTASAVSPYPRRRQSRRCRDHCDCCDTQLRYEAEKVALLRRIQGDLTALREQRQRHHEEVMAYRRKKLALLAAASAKTAGPD
ncbi:myb-related transcription factor, partner of profilin-like [Engraulis encrasicolus]|uniref:myb-related transcription factor, partner of profilin-like n=1 Tax=Engraulis encrasicolus TaxID=184585 RepID=UPI002FD3EDF1